MSSSAPPLPEAGGDAGRIRCLYCGANNFPASAACWQCGRALKAMPAGSTAAAPSSAPNSPPNFAGLPGPLARPGLTESALAPKAAAALGMLFPFVGLPAGIIFLMLDDPRKTQLGWMLIGWSLLGSVLSIVPLALTLGPLWSLLKAMLPHPGGAAPGGLPGMPSLGGPGTWMPSLAPLLCHFPRQ